MPRIAKVKRTDGIDIKGLLAAFDEFEEKYGISRTEIARLLCDSIAVVVKKKHYDDLADIMVDVDMDVNTGKINIDYIKNVVDDVEDDAVEIALDEAKEIDPNAVIGGQVKIKFPIEEFGSSEVNKLKTVFVQKIKEAQKAAVYENYKDKIDELITGTVENIDPRGNNVSINIGRTIVTMSRRDMIGDEIDNLKPGQQIKVYLSSVGNNPDQGISVSRSCKDFLKRLFEDEIRDIFDGTVVIKDIARDAGERSKVSVYSNDVNVDPVGACIGAGGSKIQKICSQINREKIDIIQYHEHIGLFIADCLQPANVLGVKDNQDGTYLAVIKNGDTKVAIGRKGVNIRLAIKLVGHDIKVIEESAALENGIEYVSVSEMKKEEEAQIKEKKRQALIEQIKNEEKKPISLVAKADDSYLDDDYDYEDGNEFIEENVEEKVVETPVEEEKKAETVEKVEYNPVILDSHVSISELEKEIEEERKQQKTSQVKKKTKTEEKVKEEKKEEHFTPRANMYTEDEIEEIEAAEEAEYYDDDEEVDYDEYDHYYDE